MSVIIRLQGLPWSASAADIRQYFKGLNIPPGGVHIIGGEKGDAFIAFATDEDARQAMMLNLGQIGTNQVMLYLSSKTQMQNVIAEARGQGAAPTVPAVSVVSAAPAQPRPADPYQQQPTSMATSTAYSQYPYGQQQMTTQAGRNPYDLPGLGSDYGRLQDPISQQHQQQHQQQWRGLQGSTPNQYDPYGSGLTQNTASKLGDMSKPPDSNPLEADGIPRSMSLFDRRKPPQNKPNFEDESSKGMEDMRKDRSSIASSQDSLNLDGSVKSMSSADDRYGRGQGDNRSVYPGYDQGMNQRPMNDPDDRSMPRSQPQGNPFGILSSDLGGQFSNPNFWEKIAAGVSSVPDVKHQQYPPVSSNDQSVRSDMRSDQSLRSDQSISDQSMRSDLTIGSSQGMRGDHGFGEMRDRSYDSRMGPGDQFPPYGRLQSDTGRLPPEVGRLSSEMARLPPDMARLPSDNTRPPHDIAQPPSDIGRQSADVGPQGTGSSRQVPEVGRPPYDDLRATDSTPDNRMKDRYQRGNDDPYVNSMRPDQRDPYARPPFDRDYGRGPYDRPLPTDERPPFENSSRSDRPSLLGDRPRDADGTPQNKPLYSVPSQRDEMSPYNRSSQQVDLDRPGMDRPSPIEERSPYDRRPPLDPSRPYDRPPYDRPPFDRINPPDNRERDPYGDARYHDERNYGRRDDPSYDMHGRRPFYPSGRDTGLGNRDMGPGNRDMGPGNRDMGPSIRDMGPGNRDMGPSSRDIGLGSRDMGLGSRDIGPGSRDMGPGSRDMGPGSRDIGPGNRDTGPGPRDIGPGGRDLGKRDADQDNRVRPDFDRMNRDRFPSDRDTSPNDRDRIGRYPLSQGPPSGDVPSRRDGPAIPSILDTPISRPPGIRLGMDRLPLHQLESRSHIRFPGMEIRGPRPLRPVAPGMFPDARQSMDQDIRRDRQLPPFTIGNQTNDKSKEQPKSVSEEKKNEDKTIEKKDNDQSDSRNREKDKDRDSRKSDTDRRRDDDRRDRDRISNRDRDRDRERSRDRSRERERDRDRDRDRERDRDRRRDDDRDRDRRYRDDRSRDRDRRDYGRSRDDGRDSRGRDDRRDSPRDKQRDNKKTDQFGRSTDRSNVGKTDSKTSQNSGLATAADKKKAETKLQPTDPKAPGNQKKVIGASPAGATPVSTSLDLNKIPVPPAPPKTTASQTTPKPVVTSSTSDTDSRAKPIVTTAPSDTDSRGVKRPYIPPIPTTDISVFVKGLPQNVNYRDLRQFFSGCEIPWDGMKVINNEKGERNGTAYIKFMNQRSFWEGLNKHGKYLNEKRIEVTRCTLDEFEKAVDSFLPNRPLQGQVSPEIKRPRKEEVKTEPATSTAPPVRPQTTSQSGIKETFSPHILQIRGLGISAKPEDVTGFFKNVKIGKGGKGIHIEYDMKRRATGIGFLEFDSLEEYRKALTFDNTTLFCRIIRLTPATSRELNQMKERMRELDKSTQNGTETNKPTEGHTSTSEVRATGLLATPPKRELNFLDVDPNCSFPYHCVHLQGLPPFVMRDDIGHFFTGLDFVKPQGIQVVQDSRGRSLGEAFVEFSNPDHCQRAVRMSGHTIKNMPVTVKPIEREEMVSYLRQMRPPSRGMNTSSQYSGPGQLGTPHPRDSNDMLGSRSRGPPPRHGPIGSGSYGLSGPGNPRGMFSRMRSPMSLGMRHPVGHSRLPLSGMRGPMSMGGYPSSDLDGQHDPCMLDKPSQSHFGRRYLVKIQGLPFTISTREIVNFMSAFNPINETVRIIVGSDPDGTSAIVGFWSIEEAENAIKELDKTYYANKQIHLSPANS